MIFSDTDDFKFWLRQICGHVGTNSITSNAKTPGMRHDCYHQCCDHATEMSVHLYGTSPQALLHLARPREDPETKVYRLAAYQPTTKSTAEKGLSVLAKIFNPTLYSIRWKDLSTQAKELQNYTLNEYPEFKSIVQFVSDSVLKKMLADPNAVIAVRPRKMDLNQTDRVQPIAKVYGSPNVWYYDSDMYLIWTRTQVIDKNGNTYYFEYYDGVNIIEFHVNFPNSKAVNLFVDSTYAHGAKNIPVWHLKGIPDVQDNGTVMQKSFFDAALPHWNLAIMHESDLFGAYINHLHPLRTELAEECDFVMEKQQCNGGMIRNPDGNSITCPACHGSGHRSVKSPYGIYMYDKDKLEGTAGGGRLSPVEYVTVPTDATKMLEARVDKMHEKGLNAINMDIVNNVGENQSGVAKTIDRSELNDFMFKIASVLFDVHIANIFYYFNILMFKPQEVAKPNPVSPDEKLQTNLPEISKPVSFDISSADDLLNELATTKKAGLSPEYLRMLQKQVIAKKFAADDDILKFIDTLIDLDPLPDILATDIIALQSGAQKTFNPEDLIVHFNIGKFLREAVDEDEKFYTLDRDQQYDVLYKKAQDLIIVTKTKLSVGGVSSDTQMDDDQIEDPALETADNTTDAA